MLQLLFDNHMGNGGQRYLHQGIHVATHALRIEAHGVQAFYHAQHVRSACVGMAVLSYSGNGEGKAVVRGHGCQARRPAITDVVLSDQCLFLHAWGLTGDFRMEAILSYRNFLCFSF